MKDIKNTSLLANLRQLISESRQRVASTVNSEITLLYWHIGHLVSSDILNNNRAEYGKQIIASLSAQLSQEYGKGWSERQLAYCVKLVDGISRQNNFAHSVCKIIVEPYPPNIRYG